jgi:hypothetical protein
MTDEAKPVATEPARCHPPDPPEAIPSLSRRGWRGRVHRAGRRLWPDPLSRDRERSDDVDSRATIRARYTIITAATTASAARSTRCAAISTSGEQCRVSARPARSPCTMCIPCTSRRPISPALSAACCCSSTARPTSGPRSAVLAGSRNSTTCCSPAAQP